MPVIDDRGRFLGKVNLIDAAVGLRQQGGARAHRLVGTDVSDNLADPDRIAETYLHLHRQHRSTWAFEVALRPWVETW